MKYKETNFLTSLGTVSFYNETRIDIFKNISQELKSGSQRESCTSTFIAAFFPIAQTWQQPKYSLMNNWLKKMWHIHTM